MIPEFPQFKKLEFSDRGEIINITRNFPPYSDFNFFSMWSWNTEEKFKISQLNGNLVINLTDYLTQEPFLSFIGIKDVEKTAQELITFAKKKRMNPLLRLVPEESASQIKSKNFLVSEDRDNFDYILPIEKLLTYGGNKMRAKRNFTNRFNRIYSTSTRELDLSNKFIQNQIIETFTEWSREKKLNYNEESPELIAIKRLLNSPSFPSIVATGVYDDAKLIGFVINENIDSNFGILHFEKAEVKYYVGIYPHLLQKTAQALHGMGCNFLNYEQDLGIFGLRKSKESYEPAYLLKKYIISFL